MCMSKVTWKAKSKSNTKSPVKWQDGFKVFTSSFRGDKKITTFPHFHKTQLGDYSTEVQLNTVLKAKPKLDYIDHKTSKEVEIFINSTNPQQSYLAGFHIFPSRMAAKLYQGSYGKVFEVKYRKVVAEGEHDVYTQFPADCVIALEMEVIKEHVFTEEEIEQAKKLKYGVA